MSALDEAAGTAGTLLDDGARDETLRRQIYNLLTLRPLIELAANQGRNDALPETLDVLFLTLAALDYISESMGLGVGASPDDTVAHLASICKDMDPALGQERALAAARRVMDALENRDATGNDRAFRFSYWTASAFAERVFRLVEVHEDRAEAVYVLTPDGLLACLALLDADLLTNVDDLLVERAMKRGRIADAMVFARRARKRSTELRTKIQTVIDRAVRSPLSVRWEKDCIPFLDEARGHLQERKGLEQGIIQTAWVRIGDASGGSRKELHSLVSTLEDTQSRHDRLFLRVCNASEEFRTHQLAAFHARSTEHIADLERDIFLPLAALSVQALSGEANGLINATLPARIPLLFDPLLLIESLCDMSPQEEATGCGTETLAAPIPIDAAWVPFDPEQAQAVRAFVIEALRHPPVDLSSIIDQAIAAGFPETLVNGVFIAGVLAFDQDSRRDVPAYDASRGDIFQRGTIGGDDIHFTSVQQEGR